ncbi:PKD domain-containing protein [Marivirga sericea]|uniref:PKD domain-containing protein n=1 Tax=Marivirga sericea TaxID=1028 RepID=A0A1X7JPS7_9BACT|nr:PKD domain-containing protein [Marivirga sericea]SMG30273.1 PKD domain-containing protein [Marivirga sericea]
MRYILIILFTALLGACSSIDDDFPVPPASTVSKFSVEVLNEDERRVQFTNESIIPENAGSASYTWSFGDGTTSSEVSPVHTYEAFGEYEVKLVVLTTSSGEIKESAQELALLQSVDIDFTLYYMDSDMLQIIGVGEQNVTADLNGFGNGLAIDRDGGKLYYADDDNLSLNMMNLDGSSPEVLYEGVTGIGSVAVDTESGKVYWTNRTDGVVQRGNLDGSGSVETVIEGLELPEGIAVYNGKIYVSDVNVPPVGENIYVANTNGSGLEIFVAGSWGYGMAVDPVNQKLYFGDQAVYDDPEDNRLKSVSLNDNSDIVTVATIEPIGANGSRTYGISINTEESKVYWADRSAGRIKSANFDGSGIETVLVAEGSPRGLALNF